jgi:hypothetical protein
MEVNCGMKAVANAWYFGAPLVAPEPRRWEPVVVDAVFQSGRLTAATLAAHIPAFACTPAK